ncbi:hypothetical protein BC629DRAFT_1533886 [Irpex lacteus]|nr:hypothetical protein BC629DRAFT_1533886 [Irpex lacteus]
MIHTIIGPTQPALGSLGIVTPFYSILPSMIICRFMLNLRHIEPAGSSWMSGTQSRSMRFAGNMGKSLQIGGEDDEDDEEIGPWSKSVSAWADVLPDGVTGSAGDAEADERDLSHNYGANSEAQQLEVSSSSHRYKLQTHRS